MRSIEAVLAALAQVLVWMAVAALLTMTSLVVLAAGMRYVVARPFDFTEELVALLYMTMVFLAVPVSTVRRGHVSITVLSTRLMTAFARPLGVAAGLVMIVFCVWFTIEGVGFVRQSYRFNSRSEQVEILLWPWMALIPLAMGFVALISIFHLVQTLWAWRTGAAVAETKPVGDAL